MSNEKLKDALKSEITKENGTDSPPADSVEITETDLDGVAGGCGLLLTCGNYSTTTPPVEN
ncbi:hypothetical protein [Janthinobacterium fluminis]|uniref:Uncharacterized protein n=1 Tax=Janthinobacterium fluminis TaxID=2987524 RepID=A0ABT5K1F4_9BURK|nr:hypothetical protein [Janthinobacterium fluminis]MDC8758807.1 hypothetical protein [Janthinobacterium fluminis]